MSVARSVVRKKLFSRTWFCRLLLLLPTLLLLGYLESTPKKAHAQKRFAATVQAFSDAEWEQVDTSLERSVEWIVVQQQRDGSFPTISYGQPGVTSLGALALMSQGELPEQGKHGDNLARAIDYVLNCQKRNGLLALVSGPNTVTVPHNVPHLVGQTAVYNHAISGLMLAEAYSTTGGDRSERMRVAIEKALKVTLGEQSRGRRKKVDQGGWRYLDQFGDYDSDLSVIGWQLMFLRSAKNAGFDVPASAIDGAVGCIKRHFSKQHGRFNYTPVSSERSRAMTGAGILALAHAGLHDSTEAKSASESMLKFTFANYNQSKLAYDRYHYSLFHCTQAAYQMGDAYWEQYYPEKYRTLLRNQNSNGSWSAEKHRGDAKFGSVYTTSLVVLSLSASNQLLPIYQR